MIHISTVFLPFLIFVVLNLAQLPSFAKRAGGGGGGFRSSSGGSFGRSSGSSFGRSSSSGFGRSSSFGGGARWGSTGFSGGQKRVSFAGIPNSRSSPGVRTIGSSSPSASRSSWGSSSSSGTRFGGATGSGRIGGGSPGVSGGSGGSRFGSSNSAGAKAASPGRIGTSLAAGGLGGAAAGSAVRYGSGSYSGLGSSAGKVGAGNSGGIYSSGSGTRWGSSAASGSGGGAMAGIRNRFAGTGNAGGIRTPSAGNARPNYGSSFGSGGRPRVSAPAAATAQRVTVNYSPQYTTYNTRYGSRLGGLGGVGGYGGSGLLGGRRGYSTGSLIATGAAAGIGGYYLGRMMGRLHSPWGYGGMYGGYGYGGYPYGYGGYGGYVMPGCVYGCSPYAAYVPYRDRYSEYYSHQDSVVSSQNTVNNYNNNNGNNDVNNQGQGGAGGQISGQTGGQTATATESPSAKNVDLCTLARWNRELPFAELPNMALDFLANNNISGNSTSDKAKFLFEFFTVSVDAYEQYNSSADIFTIPSTYDVKACNIQVSKSAVVNSANAVQSEEPILTSLRHMLNLYSNKSSDSDSLRDVVTAAKLCVPQGPNITNPEILPCLDFSITPEQLLKLEDPRSMFGSAEICRRQLSPDMFKCMPKSTPSGCQMQHLQTINLFARNFYLCSEAVDDKTPSESGAGLSRLNGADAFKAAFTPPTTKSNVIHYSGTGWDGTTTAKPGFWSRIFG